MKLLKGMFFFVLMPGFLVQETFGLNLSSGVRVGGPSQSYYVTLLTFGPFRPILGLDFWGGSFKVSYDYRYEENYYGDRLVDDTRLESEGSLRLFMPRAGIKYFRGQKDALKSYVLAEGFIVIPTVSFEATVNGEKEELKDEDRKRIKDGLDFIGITLAVGTEYFFSDQFSIGGEFGMNWLLWDYSDSDSDSYYGSSDYNWTSTTKYDAKAKLGGSFARMTLNYYFE
ncbi:MAG: hypothetical protein ACE5LH_04835 [Fidelibacterota bacterium]